MYNTQPQTTLPPITSLDNGIVDNYNSSSLVNGDMLQPHIKQEQDFEQSPPSLPPIRTPSNNTDNSNNNNNNKSRMSINQLCNDTESDYPEEMKEAAAVLANISSQQSQPQQQPLEPQTLAEPSQVPNQPSAEPGIMSRIGGGISIVKNAYEQGNIIKYTAEIVKHYARAYKNDGNDDTSEKFDLNKDDALGQSESEIRKRRAMGSRSSSPSYISPSRSHRTSQSSGSSNSIYAPYTYPNSTVSATSTSTTQNRLRRIVIGTGAAVGAAGAAVSEESMKSLKYCLQWINYATQHIDAQIIVLKEFIVSLTGPSDNQNREIVPSTTTLASIKKEVIDTLRKVIEVVSKYAGACLPDHAKISVRNFILTLPTRWATINHSEHSTTSSPISSPPLAPASGHPINQTSDYARRLLSLATESLDMLKSVAGIFGETVGRAEILIESLKVVGFSSASASTTTSSHFDNTWPSQPNGYNSYSSSSTPSHSGRSSRRSSNSARMNHGPRKHSRPIPVHLNDDDDVSDTSSESESEQSMRMEMDTAQKRAFNKSQQHNTNGLSNGTKKRKKGGKKESDRMDIS